VTAVSSRVSPRSRLALALLALALGACARNPSAPAALDPFPPDSFQGGWKRGERLRFAGSELYSHIDGGAEVFLELGFDSLEVQRYLSPAGEVAVELYRMTDPTAALGIYLLKCGAETRDPGLTDRHTVNPYQLQLVRGSVYLSVNRTAGEPSVADLVAFARNVAAQLPGGDGAAVLTLLPTDGRVAGSERIVRGPFTLQEVVTLGEGDVLQLGGKVTAVAADFAGPEGISTRLVAAYPDEAAAAGAFANLRSHLDPYLEVVVQSAGRLVFRDHAGRFGAVERRADRVELEVNLASPPTGVEVGPASDPVPAQ
jgi:hypothetical protein